MRVCAWVYEWWKDCAYAWCFESHSGAKFKLFICNALVTLCVLVCDFGYICSLFHCRQWVHFRVPAFATRPCAHISLTQKQNCSFNDFMYPCDHSGYMKSFSLCFLQDFWIFSELCRWFQCPLMPQNDISFYSNKQSRCAPLPLLLENEIIQVK